MRYKIVVTRFWSFPYYQRFFVKFYSQLADEIHIWADCKDIELIKFNLSNCFFDKNTLKFFVNPREYVLDYYSETNLVNKIFVNSLSYAKRLIDKDYEVILIFADEDEIIEKEQLVDISEINFAIFYEFYLPKESNADFEKFYSLFKLGKVKGRILDAWSDIFYKTNILLINRNNIDKFKKSKFTSGFHRLIYKNKILGSKDKFFVAYHFKGIPFKYYREKIKQALNKKSNNDDWLYVHFQQEFKKLKNYDLFYQDNLKSLDDLQNEFRERYAESLKYSFFDDVIIKENIKNIYGHRPSKLKKI